LREDDISDSIPPRIKIRGILETVMKKIIEINRLIFPFLVSMTFFLIFLETYSYIGFIGKFIIIDSRFFLALSLVSAFLLRQKSVLVFKVNRIILPLLLALYLVMQVFEAARYHNYIFSSVHLQPGNFFYLIVLSGGLFIFDRLKKGTIEVNNILKLGIILVSIFIFTENFTLTAHQAISSDLYILLHPRATYGAKMQNYWGFFYEYMTFVKSSTLENSTIMIPPQELPWLSIGNGALVRYFLYPRKIISGKTDSLPNIGSADYVMIAWGEWEGSDPSKYGWPKVNVPAEKTIYMNKDSKAWGIIKIKK
jgi:voltage-gated potassium channel Kch